MREREKPELFLESSWSREGRRAEPSTKIPKAEEESVLKGGSKSSQAAFQP